jgi:TatA/E family protein of Tat protein translocase
MFGLGTQELMLILAIALVLFGGAKIPELGRSLGQAIREFKKGIDAPDPKPAAPADPDAKDKPPTGA